MLTPNRDLMLRARERLRGKWGIAVGVSFVYFVILSVLNYIPYIGWIVTLVITGPLFLGFITLFLFLARGKDVRFGQLFGGFSYFGNAFLTYMLMIVFILLWTLLLIIPGIVASFAYALTFFVMADDVNSGGTAAINKSKALMRGNKWKLCCLMGRFFGWLLLCMLTMGIGFLWFVPYAMTSLATFYDDVRLAYETEPQPDDVSPAA